MTFGVDLESSATLTEEDLQEMADAAFDGWSTGSPIPRSRHSSLIVLVASSVFAYDVVASGDPPPAAPFKKQLTLGPLGKTGSVAGSTVSDPLPGNVAQVMTFRTPISTRRTRGRIYLMPPMRAEIANDARMTESVANDWELVIQGWIGGVENSLPLGQTLNHVVVSLQESGLVTGVTQYQMKRRVDTQRRRLSRTTDTPT